MGCSPQSPQPLSTDPGCDKTHDEAEVGSGGFQFCGGADTRACAASQGQTSLRGPWAPSLQLAGRAPTLQSCQLSWGAYASPAVPPGAGAFVPSWCRGGQSPQLRAERPSKHQSPSVLPAKFHRAALLVPRSPIARPAPPRPFRGREERKQAARTPLWCWGCSLDGTNEASPGSCCCPHPKPREGTAKGRAVRCFTPVQCP